MSCKLKYLALCSEEKSIPIFSQPWWLDSLAGEENWGVVLVEGGGQIVATMPYVVKRRLGRVVMSHPPLTQTLGPWIRDTGAKQSNRLSRQKDLMQELIKQLPRYDHFSQNWHHSQTNWLPFYWAGFKQTTRYTYRLNNLNDIDMLWKGFGSNIKSDIRKAEVRFKLTVRTDIGVDDFLELNRQTFVRQGMELPYTDALVKQLDSACKLRNARQIFIAEDEQGKHHAGVYIIWDANTAYYLMGGGDPELRNSGATSLCLWEAIKFSGTVSRSFDFEGSMIEPIERFFRSFGAQQTPYLSLSHTPSKLLYFYHCFRSVMK